MALNVKELTNAIREWDIQTMTLEISDMRDRCENLNLQLLDFKEAQNILIESNRGYQKLLSEEKNKYEKLMDTSNDKIYELKHQIAQFTSDEVSSEHLAKQVLRLNDENLKLNNEKIVSYNCTRTGDIRLPSCGKCLSCKMLESQQKVKMLEINLSDANKEIIKLTEELSLYNCNDPLDKCDKCVMCQSNKLLEKVKRLDIIVKNLTDCGEELIDENTSLKTKCSSYNCIEFGGFTCGGCISCELNKTQNENKLFKDSIAEQSKYIVELLARNIELETINDKVCRSKFILYTALNRIKNNGSINGIIHNWKIAAEALIENIFIMGSE